MLGNLMRVSFGFWFMIFAGTGFIPVLALAAPSATCTAGSGKVTIKIVNSTQEDLICNVICTVTYPDKAVDWLHCNQKEVSKGKSGICSKTTTNTYNGSTKLGSLQCQ